MRKIGVYCITNIFNNKKYIGASVNISKRWSQHKNMLRRNIHKNTLLQTDWIKFGEQVFAFVIIELITDNLSERERYWIEELNTTLEENGYNYQLPKTTTQPLIVHERTKTKEKIFTKKSKKSRKIVIVKDCIAYTFDSISKASKITGFNKKRIQEIASGYRYGTTGIKKKAFTHYGCIIKYYEEYVEERSRFLPLIINK